MNWGTVPEWLTIGGAILLFIIGQTAAWVVLRKTVKANSTNIAGLRSEFANHKEKAVTTTSLKDMLQSYLEKTTENAAEIKRIKEVMLTGPMHDGLQRTCQSHIVGLINAQSAENAVTKDSVREIKECIAKQTEHLSYIAVEVGKLTTKIEERTR